MLNYEQKKRLKLEVNKTIDVINSDDIFRESKIGIRGDRSEIFKNYDVLYHNATEDMSGYYPEFGNPSTFLTIASSGDQILNAVKIGARKIDAFDVNFLSKRGCALKLAAVRTFDLNLLQDYFSSFSEKLYTCLEKNLSEEDLAYWNSVYDFVGEKDVRDLLFAHERLAKELIMKINPYMDKDSYLDLQRKLDKAEINYIDADLYSLPSKLGNNTYDAMNFSNIYEYINYGYVGNLSVDIAHNFYKFIMDDMYPKLNENGTIMLSYMYAFSDRVKQQIDEFYALDPSKLIISGEFVFLRNLVNYKKGFTTQNYSYSLLLNEFKNENIKKVVTSHVRYGQSQDMSNDMALCLKKVRS